MNKNAMAGGIFSVFSLVYIVAGTQIPASSYSATIIGPRVFPLIIGSLLFLASVTLFIKGMWEKRTEKAVGIAADSKSKAGEMPEEEEVPQSSTHFGVIILLLLVYLLLFVPLGYILSTGLFIFAATMYLERQHWKRNLLYAIIFPVAVFFLFNDVLAVYLPTGPFS